MLKHGGVITNSLAKDRYVEAPTTIQSSARQASSRLTYYNESADGQTALKELIDDCLPLRGGHSSLLRMDWEFELC